MSTEAGAADPRPAVQIIQLAGHHLLSAMRGGSGIIFCLITLMTGLIIAEAITAPIERAASGMSGGATSELARRQVLASALGTFATPAIAWALGGDSPLDQSAGPTVGANQTRAMQWADYLLNRRPGALSAIFLILLFSLPFIIPFIGFDQFAGDIGARRLRYLLPRTTRGRLFIGRTLGTCLFAVACLGLTLLIIGLYVGLQLRIYPLTAVWMWTAATWLKLSILTLPYVALCSAVSASLSSSMGSLVAVSALVGCVPMLALAAAHLHPACGAVGWLLPMPFQIHLFEDRWLPMVLSGGLTLAYAAAYLLLGMWIFVRRDL